MSAMECGFSGEFFHKVIDFIFPAMCPMCGNAVECHGQLCAKCWSRFNWVCNPKCCKCGYPFPANLDLGPSPLCPVCASGQNEVDWCRSACVYDEVSRGVMLPFKHIGKTKYSKFMSRAMTSALNDLDVRIDIVLPVPLAYRRLIHRGYNQASLLARPIARFLGSVIDFDNIRRAYRSDMGHKNSRQRHENIRGVFSVKTPEVFKGKNVLLVDDVMTSGATFAELNRVLKKCGARTVCGITFCRVVRAI